MADMYLRAFCREHSFPAEAEETLVAALTACQGKPMGEMLTRLLEEYDEKGVDNDFYEGLRRLRTAPLPDGVSMRTTELIYFILASRHLWELYQEQGLPYQIYFDSMEDLKCKLQECRTVHGEWGSFVGGWFCDFFTLKRFALGRLQYEAKILKTMHPVESRKGDTYTVDGYTLTPDSLVINVHIPSAGPLMPQDVAESFRQATAFYAHQFEDRVPFVCYSWLLFAPNRDILPESSRIRQFMDFFTHVWDQPDEKGEDLWRIFGTQQTGDLDALPQDTSLQRAYYAYLKQGNLPGEALAFRIEPIVEG